MSGLQLEIKNSNKIEEQINYQRKWEDYKILNRNFYVAEISIAAFLLCTIIGIFNPVFYSILYSFILFGVIFVPLVYVAKKLENWKCPQCNEKFHRSYNKTWLLAKKCMNCGLPKYEGSIFRKP